MANSCKGPELTKKVQSDLVFCCFSLHGMAQIYNNSQHFLFQSPRDSLKYFEISIPPHIRFAELRKKINQTTTFHKLICNLTPEIKRYIYIYIIQTHKSVN